MAVEIRELVIRATVHSQPSRGSGDCQDCEGSSSSSAPDTNGDRGEIVRAAVEQVLRILKASKER